mmetsp:Transcript_38217/g.83900  ORF Transcript_38217/g.83900 Transcript_38217/m.83900 type:complete len:273 (+) Transcript_38217:812-1630(+)
MKSSPGRACLDICWTFRRTLSARALRLASLALNCIKLELLLGIAFLKSSSASSSLSSLMVSERAISSSARVFLRSSHSAALLSQPFSSSARYSLSLARAFSVSARSFFFATMATATSPVRTVFSSMDWVSAATSFALADESSSYSAIAASSAAVASERPFAIVSLSCFRMPMISPLLGTYSDPSVADKNDANISLSSSGISCLDWVSLRKTCAAPVWRKPPVTPFSRAAMAFASASTFAPFSAFSAAYAAACFSRIAVASAAEDFAASRSSR